MSVFGSWRCRHACFFHIYIYILYQLNSSLLLQQRHELASPMKSLKIRVAANVLAVNVDVRDRPLARQKLELMLNLVAVGTLVELDNVDVGAFLETQGLQQKGLGGAAVPAPGLAGNEDGGRGVGGNQLLGELFDRCGDHGGCFVVGGLAAGSDINGDDNNGDCQKSVDDIVHRNRGKT